MNFVKHYLLVRYFVLTVSLYKGSLPALGGAMVSEASRNKSLPVTTSNQLALDLFDQLSVLGKSISESPSDIGFQRNNAVVEVSNLGAVAYRALDALIFVIQNDPNIQGRYDIDLNYFRWLMRYESNNYRHFRSVLRELQQAAIQIAEVPESDLTVSDRWISVPMLGPAAINNGRLIFEMAASLQRHLKDPAQAHWLSLRASAQLSLIYARVIYNRVLPFLAEGETEWFSLESVQAWPGKRHSTLREYKYFRRDSLNPAIDQINEISDINIRYETKSESPGKKKISFLRFIISRKEKSTEQILRAADEIYRILKEEFGLTPKNFDEIQENRDRWTNQWIENAIEYTRWKMKNGELKKSVSGFLMYALRNNLYISSSEKVLEEQQRKLEEQRIEKQLAIDEKIRKFSEEKASKNKNYSERFNEESLSGMRFFNNLPPDEREKYILAFSKTLSAKTAVFNEDFDLSSLSEEKILKHSLLMKSFGNYMNMRCKRSRK